MKLLIKILTTFIIIIVLLAVAAIATVKHLAPQIAANFVKAKTGFAMSWDKFDIEPFAGRLSIKEFTLNNDKSFDTPLMLSLPELTVDADLTSLQAQPYMIEDITVHLGQINLVRNKDGKFNYQLLQEKLSTQAPAQTEEESTQTQTTQAQKAPDIYFAHIKLQADTLKIIDYSMTPTKETTVNIGFKFERENVTTQQLTREVSKEVMPIVMKSLGPILVQEALGSALGGANMVAGEATGAINSGLNAAGSSLDGATKKASEATQKIKEAAGALKSIKGIFGK